MIDIERIEQQTIELVKEVGRFIREQRAQFDTSKIEHKGLHDYVSYVDKGSERQLVDGLSKILPGCGFIVEENTAGHSTEENIWIIDPLDGTTNFLHNVYPFAISVALQQGDKTVLGIVYELGRDEFFYSCGNGAKSDCNWLSDKQIRSFGRTRCHSERDCAALAGHPPHWLGSF